MDPVAELAYGAAGYMSAAYVGEKIEMFGWYAIAGGAAMMAVGVMAVLVGRKMRA